MLYVHAASGRGLFLALVATVTFTCLHRHASAQVESRPGSVTRIGLPQDTAEFPRLDERLNLIRTQEQHAAFEEYRAALRIKADGEVNRSHSGRVWKPYSDQSTAGNLVAVTVFTVNTDYDDPDISPGDGVCYDGFQNGIIYECTLRAAIQEANLTPGTDPVVIRIDMVSEARGALETVAYDVANDLWTLMVNTNASVAAFGVLPPITRDNVLIDATTQLDGSGDGTFPDAYCGRPVMGDTSIVKVAIDGSLLGGSSAVGLNVQADNVEIRGLAVKNFPGNGIFASGAQNLKIECSHLGTNHLARAAEPNGSNGLAEQGGSGFSMAHSIASGNLVSGVVAGSPKGAVDSSFFGLNVTGLAALGNAATGLFVMGDSMSATRIFASGNDDGVWAAGNDATVTNSVFGVGIDLTTPIPNDAGIRIDGDNNLIGGGPGMRVLASGNTTYGIFLAAEAGGNVISGTLVGTDLTGSVAIPNQTGIQDSGSGNTIGEEIIPPAPGFPEDSPIANVGKTFGLSPSPPSGGWANLISGNTQSGIVATTASIIVRNYIGTDSAGTSALPNGLYGVHLLSGSGHEVGRAAGNGNLISGNGNSGVNISTLVTGSAVKANYIGVDVTGASSLPNGAAGVWASGPAVIGGSAFTQNIIAFNGGAGVRIDDGGPVTVQHNQIFSNTGLGIDLGGAGVTPNDGGTPPDADSGPNGLQNFPVINEAAQSNSTTVNVASDFGSTPSTLFQFDYYRSDAPDESGNGEGAVWVKTHSASTNGAGSLALNQEFTLAELPVASWVTVTATNPQGETSEFSNAVQVTGSGVSLTGAKVFLEGPYSGGSMATDLLSKVYIPLSQPYGEAAFDGTLQEFDDPVAVGTIPAGTVDWVTLSLRTGTDAASEADRTVGFVKSDGSLVDPTGNSTIAFFAAGAASHYLVVCHRNHLCAMSSLAIDFFGGSGTWDFTTALTQAFTTGGAPMKHLGVGIYGLFAADASVDGQITAPDFNLWNAATTAGQTGYRAPDYNLDGQVTAPDFNLWNANTTAGASSKVPG
ncbi:MAG TPA: right-handed parallel beta-helix repeat-containing protein [Rhodothermales bacterium]|nr:right-handed parallel beta-helix repeat-containing protein [Rhodothermales bacterium]